MTINSPAILICLPIAIGLINMLLPGILRKILTGCGLAVMLAVSWLLFRGGFDPDFIPPGIFTCDRLSVLMLLAIQFLSLVIFIFSIKGVDPRIKKQFFILYPMTAGFCNGVILSDHAIVFIIFWGLSGLMLYLFNLLGRGEDTPESARKTFFLIGGSDALLILGFVLMGISLPDAEWSLSAMHLPLSGTIPILAFICLLCASLAKAGGFPFHTWVPSYARVSPVESVAFLPASLDKILGIYLLARLVLFLFQCSFTVNLILITIGTITVITAVMMALIQHNGRELLGYHAISQVGYMIMGVGSGSPLAFAGGLFHMINHTIYKSNLFLTLGSVEKQTHTNDLADLGGLGRKMPLTFIMALVGAFSISGIPPFNGFFSKWMIYQGILEKAKEASAGYEIWLLICFVLAIFGSALTLASFLKFLHTIFLGKRPAKYDHIKEAPFNQWLATGILAMFCIGLGLFAMQGPLRYLVFPVLDQAHQPLPEMPGLYSPLFIFVMMALAFILGMIIYLITCKVRFDDSYLGGMDALERFRVSGTEFYNEIRAMKPIKQIYDMAEKKVFDFYEVLYKGILDMAHLFQACHNGQLSLYLLFISIGLLALLWIK